jgi:hypothetical protein
MSEVKLRVISLGAGVQSTTMALMAAHGEIGPMPDCAIFADTGWEPQAVYDHLRWLSSGNVLPFPVHIVSSGNIRDDLVNRGSERAGRFITIPAYMLHHNGAHGIGRRQCTSHYKVEPIRKKVRELLGKGPRDRIAKGAVEKWIGISLDEVIRATPSKVAFEVNRHPLLEKRMSRRDCLKWLSGHGYPEPPKSACVGCPFHSDAAWREIRDTAPDEWDDAVAVDRAIRTPVDRPGVPALRGQQFLHAQRVPLDEVDLSTPEDRGQLNFLHECEGMCGV